MSTNEVKKSKRKFLKISLISMIGLSVAPCSLAQTVNSKLLASRMHASATHTRVTFETKEKLEYNSFILENPLRLVVDLTGIEITENLVELSQKAIDDKYVSSLRLGVNRPNVTRLVFSLREKVKPEIFILPPEEKFSHRIVLDIFPEIDSEVLFAKIADEGREEKEAKLEQKNKVFVIAIDAGHGGDDPGAIGAKGTYEKNITLSIARRLKEKIDQSPWMQAVLIRDGDYFIPLNQRVERAATAKADIFISIHADAVQSRDVKGSSIYVLSEKGASSATSKWLEQKENAVDLIGQTMLKDSEDGFSKTLFDLSLSGTMIESSKLANFILPEMGKINYLHKKNVESAGFAVLKSPSVPSVLIETAFISNKEEEKKLLDPTHQEKIADAIILGIAKYAGKAV